MRLTYGNKLGGIPRTNIEVPDDEIRYSPILNEDGTRNKLNDWRLYFKPFDQGGILPEYVKDSDLQFRNFLKENGEFEDNSIAYAIRDIRLVPYYDESNERATVIVAGNTIPGRWDLVADIYLYLKRKVVINSIGQTPVEEIMSGIIQSDVLLSNGVLEYNIKDCANVYSSQTLPLTSIRFGPNSTITVPNTNQIEWYYKFSVDEIESLSGLNFSQKSMTSGNEVNLIDRLNQVRPVDPIPDVPELDIERNIDLFSSRNMRRMVPLVKRGTVPKGKGFIPESGEYVGYMFGEVVKWDGFTLDSNETRVNPSGTIEEHNYPITQNIVWQTIWKTWMGYQFDNVTIDPTDPRRDDSSENGYYDGIMLALEADGYPLQSDFAEGYYLPRNVKWLRVSTRLDDDGYLNICRGTSKCVEKLPNDDCSKMPFTLLDVKRRNDLDKYTLISKDTSKFYPIPGRPCYQGLPATYDALIHYEHTSSKECFDGKVGEDGRVYGSRTIKYEYKIVSSSQVLVEWENIIRNSIDKTCECIEVSVQNPPYIDPNDPKECDVLHTDTIYTICPDDGMYYYDNAIVPANAVPTRLEIRHIDRTNCHDMNTPIVFHTISFEKDILNGLSIIKTDGSFNSNASMSFMYTSSIQDDSKKYYIDIVDESDVKTFSIMYAHVSGSGSLKVGERDKDTTSKINYSQYKLFTNDDVSPFSFYSNGVLSPESEHIYIMKFDKDSMKDRIDAGNLQISLSDISNPSNIITLIDTSQDPTNTKYFDESPYYSFDLVSGSLLSGFHSSGAGNSDTNTTYTTYGKIYPNMGIIIFDANKFVTELNFNIDTDSNVDAKNELILFDSINNAIQGGYSFLSRNTFKDMVTHYFIRVPAHHANYSNNPTFSYPSSVNGMLKNKNFFIEPVTYITTIGLYDDEKNLVAVAKLSKPLKKTMERELLFDVRISI
jgi:hypothetical protein